jgi:hypothetical protein
VEYRVAQDLELELNALCMYTTVPGLPTILAHARGVQDDNGPYPGSLIYAIVLSKLPGTPLDEIHDLTPTEMSLIQHLVSNIL